MPLQAREYYEKVVAIAMTPTRPGPTSSDARLPGQENEIFLLVGNTRRACRSGAKRIRFR